MRKVLLLLAFGCGDGVKGDCDCDPAAEVCVLYGSDVAGVPSTEQCEPLPEACSPASCGCLADQQLSDGIGWCVEAGGCEEGDDGVLHVVCPGG